MSTSETSPESGSGGWFGRLFTAAVLASVAFGAWYFGPGLKSSLFASSKSGDPSVVDATLVTAQAKRALFESVLSVQGNLDSQSNATLSSEVEGSTTIISIVPEGKWVEEGDLVVELDSSELTEDVKQQEIDVTQARAKLAQATEELEIQKTQNKSDEAAAKLEWDLAVLDLEKYEEGEYPATRKEMEGEVAIADEEYLRAMDKYDYTKRLVNKGLKTPTDLEADRIAVKGKRLELDKSQENLNVLTKYTRKREIAELKANALEFEREFARTKLKASSALAQAQAEVDSAKLTLEVETEKLDRTRRQLLACKIFAPQSGEVVYASEQSSRGRSEGAAIEEGASVRQRQAIINLPDVTKMKVDCKIHESLISQVREGLPATIRIDAFPDRVFNGRVATVSSVPMSGSWPNYDLREYALEISLTDEPETIRQLRPGLTAQVSIVADRRPDVLQVPVQAVVKAGRETLAFVMNDEGGVERRLVTLNGTNSTAAAIADGVREGERVVLNPRTHFGSEIAEVERASKADEKGAEAEEVEANSRGGRKAAGGPDPGKSAAPKGGGEAGGRGAGDSAGGSRGGGGGASGFFARFDKDSDGKLTRDELPGQMADNFDTMDADSDGSITAVEFAEAAKKFQGRAR